MALPIGQKIILGLIGAAIVVAVVIWIIARIRKHRRVHWILTIIVLIIGIAFLSAAGFL